MRFLAAQWYVEEIEEERVRNGLELSGKNGFQNPPASSPRISLPTPTQIDLQISASLCTVASMSDPRMIEIKTELEREEAKLLEALKVVQGKLSLLRELQSPPKPSKRKKLGDVVAEGAEHLAEFSQTDLAQWIRDTYAGMKFSPKSLHKPLQELIQAGRVIVLRENVGNKSPRVYQWVRLGEIKATS